VTTRGLRNPYALDVIAPDSRTLESHGSRLQAIEQAVGLFEDKIRSLELQDSRNKLAQRVEELEQGTVRSSAFQVLLAKIGKIETGLQRCTDQLAEMQKQLKAKHDESYVKLAQRMETLERSLAKHQQVSVESEIERLSEKLLSFQTSVQAREGNVNQRLTTLEMVARQLSAEIKKIPVPVVQPKKKEPPKRTNGDDVTLLEANLEKLREDVQKLNQELIEAVKGLGMRISGIEIRTAKPVVIGTPCKESSSVQGPSVTKEEVSRIDAIISSYIKNPEEKENFGFALYDQCHKKIDKPSKDILDTILDEGKEDETSLVEMILGSLSKGLTLCSRFHRNIQGYVSQLKKENWYLLFRCNMGALEYVTMFSRGHTDFEIQSVQNCWNQPNQKFLWIDVTQKKKPE